MTAFSLVPRDKHFFKEFISLAEEVRSGARALRQMIATDPPDMQKVEAIKDIEHSCDECTRAIIDRLNRTFVTPLDREDIHALAGSLDDVMDAIDAAAAVIRLYKITRVRNGAKRLSKSSATRWTSSRRRWPCSSAATGCWKLPHGSSNSSTRRTASTRTRSSSCSTRKRTQSP